VTSTALTETPVDTPKTSTRTILGLIVVFVTQLMLVVDASIVNVALPDIRDALGFNQTSLSWVVTAYALAFAGLILLSGRVGSIIGTRRALIVGTLIFIVASAVGGLAPTAELLIVARVVQGVGAALAAPSTLVLLMENTTPGRMRARAMSLFVIAAGSGGAIGLVLGGVLTTNFGWEWVMFVNVPVGILIVAGALAFLKETDRQPAKLDFAGAAASTIAMVALVFGFTTAASDGWTHPLVIGSFAVALAAVAALVFVERRHLSPVVEFSLFATARRAAPLVAMLLIPAAMFAFFYFATLFTQNVLGFDPLGTGLALVPFVGAMLITNQFSPSLLPRFGERAFVVAGLILLVAGLLWLGQLSDTSTFLSGILGPTLVMGVGAGLTFAPLTSIILEQAPEDDVNSASAMLQAMQQLGGSIGVAALTTVFVSMSAVSGQATGISTALLGGAGFAAAALILVGVWARRVPQDASRERKQFVGH
jgi:EmrB/QacA subfamily drug resistance transporter